MFLIVQLLILPLVPSFVVLLVPSLVPSIVPSLVPSIVPSLAPSLVLLFIPSLVFPLVHSLLLNIYNLVIESESDLAQNQGVGSLQDSYDLAQSQGFESLENRSIDLSLETYDYQIIGSDYEYQASNYDEIRHVTFTYEDMDRFIDSFGKYYGFSYRQSRNDFYSDYSSIRCHSYECSYSHAHKSKKAVDIIKQRERSFIQINCPWHVNFNNRKGTTEIICTSFVNEHNHKMNLLVAQTTLHFHKLSDEMLEDIKFYTCSTEGIGATLQYNLLKAKYSNKHHSWAVCYTQTCFTAGIQSMQCVEGINAIIKKEVSHNTTLLNLVDAIQNQLNEEVCYARINKQKNANPIMGLPHIASQYFLTIDSLIQEYLTSHIFSLQRQQLSESFLYDITELFFDWDKNFSESENTMKVGFFEDNYKWRQTDFKSLLQTLRDLISLHLPIKLCKANQLSLSDNNTHAINFGYLAQLRTNNVFTPALKKSISKKSHWSKGYKISKKALNLMICLNCDDEFFQMMEEFISSKACELQLLEDMKNNCDNMVEL
ncbi:7994_t:CDS:2 [Cetraspora pellucida]|uniref:7994_t:CDS:1 n=1 Tax=Cetraspora pellucida TaxID=1433469 RepID=A0ACA9MFK8_9GLOM|nr:7994_t:CDS:2 [Cetraspora pellucida]